MKLFCFNVERRLSMGFLKFDRLAGLGLIAHVPL